MTILRLFKMAAAAILDFQNVEILGAGRLKTAKMRHHAKFCGNRSNRCCDMAIFQFFKMAAAAIFGLSKGGNFSGGKGQEGQSASPCQILRRSVKQLLKYGDFSIFPRWRPSAILDL